MRLSHRIESIEESKTSVFVSLVDELRRQGREVVDLSIGEPVFETPQEVIAETKKALDEMRTRYSQIGGLPVLKRRIADLYAEGGYGPGNIVVSNGSKQSLYSLFQAICDPGDEVIIPNPCWVSFPQQVRLAGGRPVMVPTRDHQLDCAAIQAAITPQTRAILINSPNNPTGAVYPRRDFQRLAQLVVEHDLFLISDEAYTGFLYDNLTPGETTPLGLLPAFAGDLREKLIVVRSFSKHFSMTGFRVGYLVGPSAIVAAVTKLQGHLSGNVCTFAQYGALRALDLDPAMVEARRQVLEERRNLALALARERFDCIKPGGGLYIFPKIERYLEDGSSSRELCMRLLREVAVAVVPGEDFGAPEHMRICFAVGEDDLVEGFRRMGEVLA